MEAYGSQTHFAESSDSDNKKAVANAVPGKYEPIAPSFRVFGLRGIARVSFTCQFVKIWSNHSAYVSHTHFPSDHHWLFYHVCEQFNHDLKLMVGL